MDRNTTHLLSPHNLDSSSSIIRTDHRHILRTFPWDTCRRIYADPTNDREYCLFGVSYDWEHLLYSSFVDTKTLVREWLLLIQKRDHTDEEDGRGILATLSIASAEESLRVMPSAAAVFARAILYGDCIFFFEMLAMAYAYLCGAACEEEHEVLVLFCKASYEVRSDDDTVPTTDTDVVPPVMSTEGGCVSGGSCEPHWTVLAMLLRRAWNDLMASCNNDRYRYSSNNYSLLLDSTSRHQSSLKRSHTGVLFRANTAATVYENSSRKRTRATGGDGVAATRGTPGITPMTALHSSGLLHASSYGSDYQSGPWSKAVIDDRGDAGIITNENYVGDDDDDDDDDDKIDNNDDDGDDDYDHHNDDEDDHDDTDNSDDDAAVDCNYNTRHYHHDAVWIDHYAECESHDGSSGVNPTYVATASSGERTSSSSSSSSSCVTSPHGLGMSDGHRPDRLAVQSDSDMAMQKCPMSMMMNTYSYEQLALSNMLSQSLWVQQTQRSPTASSSQSWAVSRRQKKTRDKFRFTFQVKSSGSDSMRRYSMGCYTMGCYTMSPHNPQ